MCLVSITPEGEESDNFVIMFIRLFVSITQKKTYSGLGSYFHTWHPPWLCPDNLDRDPTIFFWFFSV